MNREKKSNIRKKKISEIQKDPIFIKEINKFIKTSKKVYKINY